MRICPKCHAQYDDDEISFCDCGAKLASPEPASRKGEKVGDCDEQTQKSVPHGEASGSCLPPSGFSMHEAAGFDEDDDLPPPPRQEKQPDGGGIPAGMLSVEYAVNRMLLAGGQVDLSLKLTSDGKPVKAAHVWQCMPIGDKQLWKEAECQFNNGSLYCSFISFIDNDSIFGITKVSYHIGILFEDGIVFLDMEARHEIWAKDTTPAQFNTTISVGNNSLLEHVDLPKFTSIKDLASKLNAQPPSYVPMKAVESTWRPEERLTAGGAYTSPTETDRLTLLFNGFAVYVSAKDEIRMGRNPGLNEFAIMDWKQNTFAGDFPSGMVSRQQLVLTYLKKRVHIFTEKETTLIDGISPGIGGNGGWPVKDKSKLSMGPIEFDMEIQHCPGRTQKAICFNCPAHQVKSVTLKRRDKLPEAFAMVWECCDLSSLHESLKGYGLYRRNGGFILKEPSGTFINLREYMKAPIGSMSVSVYPFVQRIIGNTNPF